jgi:hypothetical protein
MDSVSVDGKQVLGSHSAVIDSGTTLIVSYYLTKSLYVALTFMQLGDVASVKELFSNIPGAKDASKTVAPGYWTGKLPPHYVPALSQPHCLVPCDGVPTVSLSFGGKSWSIPPKALNIGQLRSSPRDCVAGITGGNVGASTSPNLTLRRRTHPRSSQTSGS